MSSELSIPTSPSTSGIPNHEDWVKAVKALDEAAWSLLLHVFSSGLRDDIEVSLAKRDLPEELVDDIEQETWLTAVRKIATFEWVDDLKFYNWLRAISVNHIRQYRRSQRGSVSIDDFRSDEEKDDQLEAYFAAHGLVNMSAEAESNQRDQLSAVDQVLHMLKPRDAEIVMRHLMGEKPRELALIYHMKPRSVSMVLLRAHETIRGLLGELS